MSLTDLPLVNACINTAVAVLLVWGVVLIKQGRREAHERAMLGAVALSALFLASYLTYHFQHGSTKFAGEGWVRPVYFAILVSHTVLAVVNLPFVIVTLSRGLMRKFEAHKRIAGRTWAVWLYVAVTGPVVYLMLYQLYPGQPGSAEAAKVAAGSGAVHGAGKVASKEAEAAFVEARRLHREQKDEAALAKYREASALGHLAARCYAAAIEGRIDPTVTATRAIEQVLAEDPTNPHCRVLEARELVFAERAKDAIPMLEAVVKEVPDDAFFQASMGFAYFRRMSYAEAAAAFEASIALDGTLPANVYNAGYAHYLAGSFEKAKPLIVKALGMGLEGELQARAEEDLAVITGKAWVCPMHPDEVGKPGEKCPVCEMRLEVSPKAILGGEDGGR